MARRYPMRKSRKPKTVSKRVTKIERYLKKDRPEMKRAEAVLDQSNITSAGTIQLINGTAEGDSIDGRDGFKVRQTSVSIKGTFSRTGMVADTYIRVALVLDKQQVSDTAPTISNIWSPAGPVQFLSSGVSLNRFNVLWMSNIIDCSKVILGMQSPVINKYLKLGQQVVYNGTAATDIQKNGLYFIILTDDTTNTLDFDGYARLNFHS